jgi:UDP-N-acetylglucosamine 2-epimerase
MKVMTIFGTRPEIIRLSPILKILDQYCEHTTVHTGQNYHESLSDIFIEELEVRHAGRASRHQIEKFRRPDRSNTKLKPMRF